MPEKQAQQKSSIKSDPNIQRTDLKNQDDDRMNSNMKGTQNKNAEERSEQRMGTHNQPENEKSRQNAGSKDSIYSDSNKENTNTENIGTEGYGANDPMNRLKSADEFRTEQPTNDLPIENTGANERTTSTERNIKPVKAGKTVNDEMDNKKAGEKMKGMQQNPTGDSDDWNTDNPQNHTRNVNNGSDEDSDLEEGSYVDDEGDDQEDDENEGLFGGNRTTNTINNFESDLFESDSKAIDDTKLAVEESEEDDDDEDDDEIDDDDDDEDEDEDDKEADEINDETTEDIEEDDEDERALGNRQVNTPMNSDPDYIDDENGRREAFEKNNKNTMNG